MRSRAPDVDGPGGRRPLRSRRAGDSDAAAVPLQGGTAIQFLIDGNNVIGHEKRLPLADPDSRQTLVRALCAFARSTRKGVTVVFDGAAPGGGAGGAALGGVRVLYAGGGRSAMSADDRILAIVAASQTPAELTLVTSDSALGNRARHLGATVLPCHKFRPLLQAAAESEAAGPEKPSHVDVGDWSRYFGIDPPKDG